MLSPTPNAEYTSDAMIPINPLFPHLVIISKEYPNETEPLIRSSYATVVSFEYEWGTPGIAYQIEAVSDDGLLIHLK